MVLCSATDFGEVAEKQVGILRYDMPVCTTIDVQLLVLQAQSTKGIVLAARMGARSEFTKQNQSVTAPTSLWVGEGKPGGEDFARCNYYF